MSPTNSEEPSISPKHHSEAELPTLDNHQTVGEVAERERTERIVNASPSRRIAILVLGMHRSGTSAITRVISLLGADLPSNLMPVVKNNNEAGFWESLDLYRLNDEILASAGSRWDDWRRFNSDWMRSPSEPTFRVRALEVLEQDFARSSMFVVKDPRICRLLPFWLEVLREFGAETKCVVTVRNPLEVAGSLRKRDGFSPAKSYMIWLRHVLDAEHGSRALNRAFIIYDGLLDDWRGIVARLSAGLDISWPRRSATADVEIDRFLQYRHRHHATTHSEVFDHPEIAIWVKETYSALFALQAQPESSEALGRLDSIRSEFDRSSDALGAMLRSEEMAREELAAASSARIGELEQIVLAREARIGELEQAALAGEARIGELEQAALAVEARIGELEQAALAREVRIGELSSAWGFELGIKNQLLHRLNAIHTSASWQLERPLHATELRWPNVVRGIAALPKLVWWVFTFRLPKRLRVRRQARELLDCGVFDPRWYVEHNPDVILGGQNPVFHWLTVGWQQGRDPSPAFDMQVFLTQHPDAVERGVDFLIQHLQEKASTPFKLEE